MKFAKSEKKGVNYMAENNTEYMTTRQYAKSRGRDYNNCRKIAKNNEIGRLVNLRSGSMERQLSLEDQAEMDRRWRK